MQHYPTPARRAALLTVVLLAAVVTYYETYLQGSVSTAIIHSYGMSLRYFTLASILGNAIGAAAALFTGIADRWGRANLVVGSLAIGALITLLGLPHATSAAMYVALYTALSLVAGVVLVATPALVRDFSPQWGRATAMAIWTLGPVLGNLAISIVTNHTLPTHPNWRFQYYIAGTAGLIIFFVALIGLRELAPAVRNQLVVSSRDQVLIEARALRADTDSRRIRRPMPVRPQPSTPEPGAPVRMWRWSVVAPAIGIGVFLMFYVTRVGFFVLYFVTTFHYTPARANGLATWYWVANALALVAVGWASDRLRVRKPFLLVGAALSIISLAFFAQHAVEPATGYYDFVVMLVLLAIGGAAVNDAWLTLFSEAVEKISPAAVARGMAVYGSVLRVAVTLTLIGFTYVVNATSTLVDHGTTVATLATADKSELATLAALTPATKHALFARPNSVETKVVAVAQVAGLPANDAARFFTLNGHPRTASDRTFLALDGPGLQRSVNALTAVGRVPAADYAYLARYAHPVEQAAARSPRQWRTWWWICLIGQVLFVPLSLTLRGRWSPRTAAADAAEHGRNIEAELAALAPRAETAV